jgi:hypothetical protein
MAPVSVASRPAAEPPAFERPARRDDELHAPADRVRFVDLEPRRIFAVDGEGSPAAPAFQEVIAAIYPVAYGLHFGLKRRGIEAHVGPLEGLWWTPDELSPGSLAPEPGDDRTWRWKLLIGIPDQASEVDVEEAIAAARRKRPSPSLDRIRVEQLVEGRSAQILHIGPYAAERPTIERLHAAIAAAGLRPRGRHHEIYVGDPRRSAPERLRTLIRQPVG